VYKKWGLNSSEKFVFSFTQKVGVAGFSEKLVPILESNYYDRFVRFSVCPGKC
jgi:hypothetical protein